MTQMNNEVPPTKDSIKVQVLTQRIAELVAQYEERTADLRAQATLQISELHEQIETLNATINELRAEKSIVIDERVAEFADVEPQEVPD